jgi:integrase
MSQTRTKSKKLLPQNTSKNSSTTNEQLLQFILQDGILTSSEIENYIIMTRKNQVTKFHQTPFYQRNDGRYFTKVNECGKIKQILAKDEKELYDKLYEFYYGEKNSSLTDLYPQWLKWRDEETSVTKNTFLWNTFLGDGVIATTPLKQLKAKDFIQYFRSITKNRTLTRKRFNDIKSVMNGIIYYAIENEIMEHNHLRDINYRQFAYKPESHDIFPYTEEERKRMLNHLSDDLYSLAIKLDFCTIIRIGELKVLKWSDIKGDYIYVHSFMNEKNEIIPYCKGHAEAGMRYLPLTDACKRILSEIKRINPDSEYLFIQDSRPMVTVTFNRRIKKCCKELGIDYRSSHKIRFSTASIMHKRGADNTELQELLGHTDLNMTNKYLKNITPRSETCKKANQFLD